MVLRRLVNLVLVFGFTVNAGALTFDGLVNEYSAGAGANAATIVIDFGLEYYGFGYSWDGNSTSWAALDAVDVAGALDVNATDWGDMGIFVNDLIYPGADKYDYGADYAGWAHYGSSDGEIWSQTGGVSFRSLSDGDWDCWVWTNYDESWNPVRTPGQLPVPEPTTLVLLAIGGLLVRKRRV